MFVVRYGTRYLKFQYNATHAYDRPELATQYTRLADAQAKVDNKRWPVLFFLIDGKEVNPQDLEICQVTYHAIVHPLPPVRKKKR